MIMEYSKLVAVSGIPGLFELISSKTDGAILKSLDDQSTKFVSSRVHNFSHLESIEIYTVRDNVNLVEVLNAMDKAGGSLPDDKDAAAVKKYFEKVYPDMDFDRVYPSDMRKMVKWYDILKRNKIEIKLSEVEEEETEEGDAEAEAKPDVKPEARSEKTEAPVAKPKRKKASPDDTEPTPKKTARKKKAE